MNPPGHGFRYAVRGIALFLAQLDANHVGLIHYQLPNRFPAHGPLVLQVCDAVVLFKGRVVQTRTSCIVYGNVKNSGARSRIPVNTVPRVPSMPLVLHAPQH